MLKVMYSRLEKFYGRAHLAPFHRSRLCIIPSRVMDKFNAKYFDVTSPSYFVFRFWPRLLPFSFFFIFQRFANRHRKDKNWKMGNGMLERF